MRFPIVCLVCPTYIGFLPSETTYSFGTGREALPENLLSPLGDFTSVISFGVNLIWYVKGPDSGIVHLVSRPLRLTGCYFTPNPPHGAVAAAERGMRNMGMRLCGVDCGEMASVDGRGGDVTPSSRAHCLKYNVTGKFDLHNCHTVRITVGIGKGMNLYDLILIRHRASSFVITSNQAVDECLGLFDDLILGNSASIGWPTPAIKSSSKAPAAGRDYSHTVPCSAGGD